MGIQRYIWQLLKPCHPRIRIPLVIIIFTATVVLTFQSSTIFSPNDLIGELRKKISPNSSHSEIPSAPAPAAISDPTVDYRSSPSPLPQTIINKNGIFISPSTPPSIAPVPSINSKEILDNGSSPSPLPQTIINKNGIFISPSTPPSIAPFPSIKFKEILDNGSSPSPLPHRTSNVAGTAPSPAVSTPKREEKKKKSPSRDCSKEKDPWRRKRSQPVTSIREMVDILKINRGSSCSQVWIKLVQDKFIFPGLKRLVVQVPRWFSPVDEEILWARREILSAPIVENDPELYPPIYRNVSTFKRFLPFRKLRKITFYFRETQK